jgi:uncharacterized protein (TIRG00374 family)
MRRLLFALLSAGLLAILLWKAGVWTILGILRRSDPGWLLLAMLFYLAAFVGRAFRFRCLLRQNQAGFRRLLQIVCWHNLWNHLLPARTGELSFVYLIRRYKLDTAVSGLSVLVVSRMIDVITVLLFLSLGLLLRPVNVLGLHPFLFWFLSLLALVSLSGILYRFSSLFAWAAEKSGPILRFLRAKRVSEKLQEAASEFERMESGAIYGRGFGWTLFLWTFQFLTFYALMLSFGVFLSPPAVVIGSAAAALASFIPSATGNFGPVEAGWALGFALVGIELRLGLATGFAMHVVLLGFSTAFAASALLLSVLWRPTRRKTERYQD